MNGLELSPTIMPIIRLRPRLRLCAAPNSYAECLVFDT
jgi:hypothetical protein